MGSARSFQFFLLDSLVEILGVGYVCNESTVAVRGREGTC